MKISDDAMGVILLCSRIGMNGSSQVKPLSLGEWNVLLDKIDKMAAQGQQPDLTVRQGMDCWKALGYDAAHLERMKELMSRKEAAARELEALNKRNIAAVTIGDSTYPVLLKRRLQRKAPPVLFYSGDIHLANKIGIAVVGSRAVDKQGTLFAQKLVEKASKEKLVIYSGGARGVDAISEKTAISSGGAAVSFLADSLSSRIRRDDVIASVAQGKLLLLSDAEPDADFSAVRAVNRNKYIYASSYGAVVVSAAYQKGGTWSGSTEAMKNRWTKVFVWNHKAYEGNMKLMERGGIPYELSEEKLLDAVAKREGMFRQERLIDNFFKISK